MAKNDNKTYPLKINHTADVLEEILANGHGGGNFRRLLILAIAREKKHPFPCCGHSCCCNWAEHLRENFNKNRKKKIVTP